MSKMRKGTLLETVIQVQQQKEMVMLMYARIQELLSTGVFKGAVISVQ